MKRFIISLSLLFVILGLYAQQSGVKINFKTNTYDYGKIKEDDGIAYYNFDFTNTGNAPLIIQRVSSTCGCATPEWPKEPIAPGKSGKVKVGYDPKGRPGPFTKAISVYSNADMNVVVLQISGEVLPRVKTIDEIYRIPVGDLRFERNHFALGRLFLNKSVTDTLKFINKGSAPIKVTTNTQSINYMKVTIVPQTVKPNEFGTIVLNYDAKARNDWGFVVDRFALVLNDEPINNNPITITASIEEDYSNFTQKDYENSPVADFNTTNHDYGSVTEGNPVEFEFVVKNTGKSDLIIRKVKASCGCTTVQPEKNLLKTGESTAIKAVFRTNGYSGKQSKSITVITNDPKRSTIILRMTGSIEKKHQ
ncbi:MAG TPA: DUF1573 domain-containing protein [Tenuifilaceae bacterium]|nr:DUF1573 domain-containing protein [Tenuifilaceae bacterium]HPI44691.1 DUF1573 domain-containing protein [Tenuifilaceae bacterium]HPN21558.1 DUF1573 domain-containing protein [Tenuifilaceae bacterium]